MCMGGSPKMPATPAAPPPPPPVKATPDKEQKAGRARDLETQRAALSKGRESTILTGPLGLTEAAKVKKQTLG